MFKFRESRDSENNPNSTPIIIGADETGSMGVLAEIIIRTGLGTIMKEIYDRKPVTDPHICCLALGDAACDYAPIQATQFEASIVLADQVQKFYLEGNGGGNGGESYPLAWLFAYAKTKCDAIKRGRKGYLFTIGDECPLDQITKQQAQRFLGLNIEQDMDARTILEDIQKDWHVFHLIVKPVPHQPVVSKWREWLGERAIIVPDTSRIAEGIVSILQIVEGQDPGSVASSWHGNTSTVVREIADQLMRV
jgi:hypothetical protein